MKKYIIKLFIIIITITTNTIASSVNEWQFTVKNTNNEEFTVIIENCNIDINNKMISCSIKILNNKNTIIFDKKINDHDKKMLESLLNQELQKHEVEDKKNLIYYLNKYISRCHLYRAFQIERDKINEEIEENEEKYRQWQESERIRIQNFEHTHMNHSTSRYNPITIIISLSTIFLIITITYLYLSHNNNNNNKINHQFTTKMI